MFESPIHSNRVLYVLDAGRPGRPFVEPPLEVHTFAAVKYLAEMEFHRLTTLPIVEPCLHLGREVGLFLILTDKIRRFVSDDLLDRCKLSRIRR